MKKLFKGENRSQVYGLLGTMAFELKDKLGQLKHSVSFLSLVGCEVARILWVGRGVGVIPGILLLSERVVSGL